MIQRVREGDQPREADGPVLAAFAAAGLMRTPAARSLMEQIDDHLAPILLMIRFASEKGINLAEARPHAVEELRSMSAKVWLDRSRDPEETARSTLRTMLRKCNEMGADLAGWHWWSGCSDTPAFITGDAPVVMIDAFRDGGWRGLLPDGSPVCLPLSPTCVLVGFPEPPLRASTVATDRFIDALNSTTAKSAYTAIYEHPSTDWPRDLQLASQPPRLSAPQHTISARNSDEPPTFPATFPQLIDCRVAELLELLEAINAVD